jgi:ribosomal protein S18 acetylase RimI-like enzyme
MITQELSLKPRPYRGLPDFMRMASILTVGRKTTRQAYYVHIGDLSWWMFYTDHDETHWSRHICLWEQGERVVGWSLLDPDWSSFDVYLLPELCGSRQEDEVLDWTIQQAADNALIQGSPFIRTVWVSEYDQDRIDLLTARGFVPDEDFMWCMECPLAGPLPEIPLPDNFRIRSLQGESEVQLRAAASHAAFGSARPFETYWPRYQRFMHSPVYNPNFDLVIEAPDGSLAAFCVIWPDPVNHVGLFEPVGTQPQFQRLGLGRGIVMAGLRRLQACGMARAMVCVESSNPGALKLYQAAGFTKRHKLHTYRKTL